MSVFTLEEQRVLLLALGLVLAVSGAQVFSKGDRAAVSAVRPGPSAPPAAPPEPEERPDPNNAPEDLLARVPGMTAALRAAIVKYRPDRIVLSAADLALLPGVRKADVDAVASHLTFPGEDALARKLVGVRLDLNEAAEEDLRRVPGIGPATARAIVDRRAQRRFTDVEELLALPGIGPKKLERLQPHLRVGGR
ncbi:MAG: helix-hairpin-helix domain-containing protein [Candidatus Wallbacteria bacterium]|nr:helix-hairpin-helix domain-containing protein [Candidatus Wallbacteria bacterium]